MVRPAAPTRPTAGARPPVTGRFGPADRLGRVGRAVRHVAAVPAAVVLLGVATGSGPAIAAGTAGRPEPATFAAPGRPAGAGGATVWGVTLDTAVATDGAAAAAVAAAGRAGVGTVRAALDWAAIERHPGDDDWRGWDALAAAARTADVALVAVVDTAPEWARRDGPWPAAWWVCDEPSATAWPAAVPPTDAADLARFAARFAARYADVVAALEVWREPNTLPHWRRTGPDPEDYGRLLTAVAAAVRAAAPRVRVVSAPLAPTTDVGVCYLSDAVFLDRLARTGALAAVDAVGVTAGGFDQAASAPAGDREVLNARRVELLQRIAVRFGVERPLWVVAAGGDGTTGDGAVDAAWLADLRRTAAADWPFAAAVFLGPLVRPDAPSAAAPATAGGGRSGPAAPALGVRLAAAAGSPGGHALPPARAAVVGPLRPPAAGSARIVKPWPDRPLRRAWPWLALAGGLAGVAVGLWLAAARLVSSTARGAALRPHLVAWLRRSGSSGVGIAALAVLLAADAVVPWPGNAPLVPAMVAVVARWPLAAPWAAAAAAPFVFAAYALGVGPQLGPKAVSPVELIAAVGAAGWFGRALVARAAGVGLDGEPRRARRGVKTLDVGVAVLVAWAALSPWWAEEPPLAAREWRTVIAEPAIVYALLRLWPDRRAAARVAWHGLVVGAVVAAGWGLAGVAAHALGWTDAAVRAEGVVRARGPYRSPNNLALILGRAVVGLASAAVFAATVGRGAAGQPGGPPAATGRWRRRMAWVVGGVCAGALMATFSRGTVLVGLPAALLWLVALAARGGRGRRALGWAAAVVVAVVLALAPFARSERVAEALTLRPGTTLYYRARLWQSAWRMGRDHPITGVGLDNFMGLYRDRYVQRDVVQERFLSHPHNVGLDWWTRLGLPGVALLGAWLVAIARRAARGLRMADGVDGPLLAAGLGSLVYGLAHGLLDNSFFLVDLALYTWVAQAMVLAAIERPPAVGPPGFEPGTNRL